MPVAGLLSSFMGGGDKGSPSSSSNASKSGDATAGFDFSISTNNAFQVGGSGSSGQSATASADKGAPGASSNIALYVAIGAAALALGVVVWSMRRK